jgi:hypothetical protein
MNTGICPKCEKVLTNVNIEEIPVHLNFQPVWKEVSFLCPYCRAIIGVGIDPVALKTDLRNEILDALGKKML